jgi:hypothetical protein
MDSMPTFASLDGCALHTLPPSYTPLETIVTIENYPKLLPGQSSGAERSWAKQKLS